ncbi:acetylglutamate kinase, partial [Candidatus Omnitrophota bacterium]
FVGEIDRINADVIRRAASDMNIPVISPVGLGPGDKLYNVNADNVSSEIAIALEAAKFVLLTDVRGIMRKEGKVDTLIPTLTMDDVEAFIKKGVIQSGMIPKVKACIRALKGRVRKTHIIDGRISHSLLLEIFTDKGIGTEIVL